jgi:hypothetical protein
MTQGNSDDIPADVRRAAEHECRKYWKQVAPNLFPSFSEVEVVARAIMAERERCAGKWLPIESAPKDGTLIIAWASGDLPYISSWMVDRWSHNVSRRRSLMHPQPTHWLIALPPPPNGDVRG